MEEEYTSNELPEVWKTEFTKQRPIIPVVFQVAAAIAMFVLGCFGEAGIGAPWWCAIMFLISGLSLLILVKKHSVLWEKCAFVTIILSIITAVAGIIYYSLEFALIRSPQSPFPHDISDVAAIEFVLWGLCASVSIIYHGEIHQSEEDLHKAQSIT